jgi:hypothetical protein
MSNTYKKQRAKQIIDNFIILDSKEEVNISGAVKKETLENYQRALDETTLFDDSIFSSAYKIVYNDLRFDAWTKFIFTNDFVGIMKEFEIEMSEQEFRNKFLFNDEEFEVNEADLNHFQNKDYHKISESKSKFLHRSFTRDMNLLTSNFKFEQKELDKVNLKNFSTDMQVNQMIVEMMKPFTGVPLSIVKKKTGFIGNFFAKTLLKQKSISDIVRREFNKKEMFDWLAKYYQIESKSEKIGIIVEILLKYNVIKPLEKSNDQFYFAIKKKVIIVGCGFSGMTAAKNLRNDFDVTVIDKNINMKYNISFYKLFSNPDYLSKLEIPMSQVARDCTFIQEEILVILFFYLT